MLLDAFHRSHLQIRVFLEDNRDVSFYLLFFFFATLIAPVHAPIRTSAGLMSRVDNVVSRRYALLNRVLRLLTGRENTRRRSAAVTR